MLLLNQLPVPVHQGGDTLDNDCDGIADDGNPGGGASCNTGALGICAGGTTQCSSGDLTCVPNNTAGTEVCDGVDNDCDGMIDEDGAGDDLTRSCYAGPAGTAGVGE